MFNEVIIIGRLANKPILRATQNGTLMATATISVERPYRNNLGVREVDYVNCLFWKGLASQVIDSCDVGTFIGIKGRIQSRSYEDGDNKTFSTFEVRVEHVSFVENYMLGLK